MDALRKAEEEKRKAEALESQPRAALSAEAGPVGRPTAREELSLEPLADNAVMQAPFGVPIDANALQFDLTEAPPATKPETRTRRGARELRAGEITSPTVQIGSFVTAQTVFGTRRGAVPKRVLQWSTAAMVVLAAVLGGAGFYYYQLTPRTHDLPAPIAERPARATEEMPAALPVEPPVPESQASAFGGVAVPEGAKAAAQPEPEEPAAGAARAAANETDAAAAAVLSEPARATPPEPLARADSKVASAADADVRPGEIRIARRRSVPAVVQTVTSAYAALQAGESERAETLYRGVLAEFPDNRDALLGLAAIAVNAGRSAEALALYRTVLAANPHDSTAAAALLSLQPGADAPVDEVALKMLLDGEPGAAHVHFALGTRYAQQGRWSDAQQAFFEAFRLDDDNADYAYNLAVSLDRMGQRAAALDYYRRAVLLSDRGGAHFKDDAVLQRIAALADTLE